MICQEATATAGQDAHSMLQITFAGDTIAKSVMMLRALYRPHAVQTTHACWLQHAGVVLTAASFPDSFSSSTLWVLITQIAKHCV